MKDFDISKHPNLIDTINKSINNGDTIEIKREPKGITLVRTSRKVIDRVEQ